jgi:glyoxylase-like metal-dependent hydrolase (beta-lactamase superfamily II)
VIQVGLLREHRSFGAGQALALLYFAGFTSLFFTLSILWQEGLGRSALETGLLVLAFACATPSLVHSAQSATAVNLCFIGAALLCVLTGLRALSVSPAEITDVICSRLHADHVGWLFDTDARPVFAEAAIWIGQGDWHHFVTGAGEMLPHICEGLRASARSGSVRLIDRDTTIAGGIAARLAPGHTPGQLCVVISSGAQRALLLGDAITCPIQLDEPAWHSMGDVDPVLAARTREQLWQELEDEHTIGVGAHFPELEFGCVRTGTTRRWCSAGRNERKLQ